MQSAELPFIGTNDLPEIKFESKIGINFLKNITEKAWKRLCKSVIVKVVIHVLIIFFFLHFSILNLPNSAAIFPIINSFSSSSYILRS